MITLKEIRTDNVVRILDTDNIRMSSIMKGDKFYIPKEPMWLVVDPSSTFRARVLVVEILEDAGFVVKPIYFSQLCRRDLTGKLIFADKVNLAVRKGGTDAFKRLCGGKLLCVKDVKEGIKSYSYDQSGNKEKNEQGDFVYRDRKAFSYEIQNATYINDSEMKELVNNYIDKNFTKITADNE